MFKDDSGIKDGTDADNGPVVIFGGGHMSECAASLPLSSLSFIGPKFNGLGLYASCWDKGEDFRKSGSVRSVRRADSNDTGSGSPATSFCATLADPRRVSRAENLERMALPYDASLGVLPKEDVLGVSDGFEEFESREGEVPGVSMPLAPLIYVATGEYITLAEVSGPLHKAVEATEATLVLDWSTSGGKKSSLASCFRGVRELSLRPFAS
jgi:hypothetical protein